MKGNIGEGYKNSRKKVKKIGKKGKKCLTIKIG